MPAPNVPNIAAGNEVFSAEMRAFHAWEASELWNAVNAFFEGRLISTTGTSATSNTIGTGDKTFTTQSGLGYVPGMPISVVNTANPANYMSGFVKSYSGTTLVFTSVGTPGGSGTFTAWSIAIGLSGGGATLGANTFTGAQNFAQGTDIAAANTTNLDSATGNAVVITGNTAINAWTLSNGRIRYGVITGTPLIAYNASTSNINSGGASYQCKGGERFIAYSAGNVVYVILEKADGTPIISPIIPSVRQTVLSGTVDTNGLPSFGGSTGSTTVTPSTTLQLTAANGLINRLGSITNPSWTGLSTNGTMFLYLDIAADGTCTPGSTTLAPTYRWGGADVTTNNQFTFNIQEMVGKVGNGSIANQVYRVFVGEVTVAGGVVTAITWYALMGRYDSGFTATLPAAGTQVSRNHNIGIVDIEPQLIVECTTADAGYAVGDQIINCSTNPASSVIFSMTPYVTYKTMGITTGGTSSFNPQHKTTGASAALTAGSWKYKFVAKRRW